MTSSVEISRSCYVLPLYITGLLYHTAAINVGTSGIPLYFVAVGLMSLHLIRTRNGLRRAELIFAIVCSVLLMITAMVHLHGGTANGSELPQLGSRIFYLLSFIVCAQFVRVTDGDGRIFITAIKLIATLFIFYGMYEFLAKRNGYPLWLEGVANNKSFRVASGLNGGWLGEDAVRVRTFWAEPSASLLPVAISFFLAARGWLFHSPRLNFIFLVLIVCYAYLTGSRNVYLACLVLFFTLVLIGLLRRVNRKLVGLFMIACITAIVAFAFTWQLLVAYVFDDLSASGRAASVTVGIGVWMQNIMFGTGFNTFETESFKYGLAGGGITGESIIQNALLANLQQAGLVGTVAIFAPLVLAILSTAKYWSTLGPMWLCIIAAGAISAGIEFSAIYWMLLAVLYAVRFRPEVEVYVMERSGRTDGGARK